MRDWNLAKEWLHREMKVPKAGWLIISIMESKEIAPCDLLQWRRFQLVFFQSRE